MKLFVFCLLWLWSDRPIAMLTCHHMIHSGCIVMQFSCSVYVIIESVKKWALGCKNLRCQWWGDCPCSCVYFTIIVCEFALKLGDFRFAKCWQLAHKLIAWSKVTSHHVAYCGYYVKKTIILTSQVPCPSPLLLCTKWDHRHTHGKSPDDM
jgi:hypothetical protein